MLTPEEAAELEGATVVDAERQEVGALEEVFLYPGDDQPAFAVVSADDRRVVVPLDGAEIEGDEVRVRYPRALVLRAPAPAGETLDPALQEDVYAHYGISDAELRDDTGWSTDRPEARREGTSRDPRGAGGADDAAQGHP